MLPYERELNSRKEEDGSMKDRELRAAMARAGVSSKQMAEALGLSSTALYNKLTGRTEFKNSEIRIIVRLLSLSAAELEHIFFAA